MDLEDNRFLIVEDEEENRDLLLRLLIDDLNIRSNNVKEAESLEQAEEYLDSFEPNIVLLDLKIPSKEGLEPDMINAFKLIQNIQLYNFKQNRPLDKIKIIIISGSIEDKAVQNMITNDNTIISFFDKGAIAGNFDRFKIDFKTKLEKAVRYNGENPTIDYSFVRKSLIKELKKIKPDLWNKIDDQILKQFEKLNDKKVNEFAVSKAILISCGELVEDIIHLFADSSNSIEYGSDINTVLRRLTKLSGRKFIGWDKESNNEPIYEKEATVFIKRISQEYAYQVYKISSQARHSKEGDNNNNKWFAGHNSSFTKEDASISINLIIPLIQDYINYIRTKD